jgi:hypothetical protein
MRLILGLFRVATALEKGYNMRVWQVCHAGPPTLLNRSLRGPNVPFSEPSPKVLVHSELRSLDLARPRFPIQHT